MKSPKLTEAFGLAVKIHQHKKWKKTERAFLHHPLGVASLVQFYGGDEEQVQAALIHDTLSEGVTYEEIHHQFGIEVANLVKAFEDPPEVAALKMNWAQSKRGYIQKIEHLPPRAIFVIACEELHELMAIIHDAKYFGASVWNNYPVPGRDLGWYYKTLTSTFYTQLSEEKYRPLVSEFASQTKILSNRVFEGIDS